MDPAVGAGARRHRGRPPPGRGGGSSAPPPPLAARPHDARAGPAGRRGGHGRQRRLTDRGEGGLRAGGPVVRGGPGRRRVGRMGEMADRPGRHLRRGERGRRGHGRARRPPERLPRDVVLGPGRSDPTDAAHPARAVRWRAAAAGGHPAPRGRRHPGRGRHGPHRCGERRPPPDPRSRRPRPHRPAERRGGRVPAGGVVRAAVRPTPHSSATTSPSGSGVSRSIASIRHGDPPRCPPRRSCRRASKATTVRAACSTSTARTSWRTAPSSCPTGARCIPTGGRVFRSETAGAAVWRRGPR